MRLIKKVLAIGLVTALTFTSMEMPVKATSYLGTQAEVVTENQTEVESETTVATNDADTVNQEAEKSTVTQVDSTVSENDAAESDKTTNEQTVTEESNSTDNQNSSENTTTTEETEVKEDISETQKLFNDALLENGTITLTEDLELNDIIELTLPKDKEEASINVELNGYKITTKEASALFFIAENVTLSIKGEGSIVSDKENGIVIYNEGTIKLDNADILATGSKSVGVLNNSTLGEKGLIIKSGTIKADWFAIGKTAKAEVSKYRPTAFFAAAGIVMPSSSEEVEQGSYSVEEDATVLEESVNSIEVTDKETKTDETVTDENTTIDDTQEVVDQEDSNTTKQEQVPTSQDTTTTDVSSQQTAIVAPEIPVNVSATVNSYSSVKITWSAVSGAKGYIVERLQTGTDAYIELANITTTEYSDTTIAVGKEYKYRVIAYVYNETSQVLKSNASTEVSAQTTIGHPQNLTAVQSSATSVKLAWDGVEGAVKYNVYRATKNGSFKLVKTTESTNYKDTGLKKGTKYSYQITAANGDYESGSSNKVSLYAAAAGVTKLKASSSAYNKIDVSWKKASGATKYVVYRSTKEGSGYKKVKTVTNTKYTDSVKTGVTYYYKVVSYSDKAKGGESAIVSGVAVPAAPTNVKAENKSYNSAKISWTKSKGAGSYAIYRSTSKKSGYTLIKTVSKSKSSYTDKTVATGTQYYYKVCAVAQKKEGKMSKVVSVKVKPAKVTKLAAKSAGGKNINLTWSAAKGATSYEVYRSTSEKKGYSKIGSTTELSYSNTKLKNGTTYYYRVYAVAGKVKGDYTQTSYVNPSKVYLSASSLNLESGETAKLKVSFKPSAISDSSITWSSANTKIATVTKKGAVTALAAGVTTITATAVNGVTASCEIRVDQEETGVVVVLDPGHGGSDPGAVSGGLRESDLNLKISNYTKAELEKYSGIIVQMTRTGDSYVGLEERTEIAKNYGADMFISQHLNSAASSANGSEVYVSLDSRYYASSAKLGSQVINRLTGLGLNNRGVKTRQGTSGDYYSVIRNSVSRGFPGIIIEGAFITGSDDREILSTEAGLKSIGVATATAIAEYYGLSKK
jgi:N-acetylmuramoyl-L-alanine amidase